MCLLISASAVCYKKMAVSAICLPVYSDWIPCEGEIAQVQEVVCVYIGATSIRRWVTWSRDERMYLNLSRHDTCCIYSDL